MAFQVQAVHKTLRVKKMIVNNYFEFLILMHLIVSTKYNNYKYSFLPFERTQMTHKSLMSVLFLHQLWLTSQMKNPFWHTRTTRNVFTSSICYQCFGNVFRNIKIHEDIYCRITIAASRSLKCDLFLMLFIMFSMLICNIQIYYNIIYSIHSVMQEGRNCDKTSII